MISILYFVLAGLGLGFLVFIHELGHYVVARREKMKIEVFSIGFGKPFISWQKEGVKWQVCWIPFGGYVRIAGMEKKGSLEPHEIEEGFYGKKPLARIKVALAGPIVNIIFAFLLFSIIWLVGGREKPFSNYTHLIGWVDPSSDLYKMGVRPGAEITEYNGKPFHEFTQLLYGTLLEKGEQKITGYQIDYVNRNKTPFTYSMDDIENHKGQERTVSLLSIINPASYLIYEELSNQDTSSSMRESGIQPGDRVLWVDGEVVFSKRQLVSLVNRARSLLTVQRGDSVFLTQIPRLKIGDLRINSLEKAELQDWAYASNLQEEVSQLFFIPYKISPKGEVESVTAYVDENAFEQKEFQPRLSAVEIPLLPGDRILAVDGKDVSGGQEFFNAVQVRHIQVIVQRGIAYPPIPFEKADEDFMKGVSFADLNALVDGVGVKKALNNKGNLYLLKPIVPKPMSDFLVSDSIKEKRMTMEAEQKKQIEAIKNPKEKERALIALEKEKRRLLLGGLLEDRVVDYNPSPVVLFGNVLSDMWKTLSALFTGYLSPKYLAGPVGIVQTMKNGLGLGIPEALYWLGLISVNLGVINLLPIPVLDGGHICFSLYEAITRKRIKAKVMERLIIPFAVLLIALFMYTTYHDILRAFFSRF